MCGIKRETVFTSCSLFHNWIHQSRSCPYCTELASGNCQERPRIHFVGCCCRRLNCFGIFNNYINSQVFSNVVVRFLWPCCVLFPLFDSKLLPMAYSLTFNLLALLCTPPLREDFMWFIASLFTFQVCTTRFNKKFFGHLSCGR